MMPEELEPQPRWRDDVRIFVSSLRSASPLIRIVVVSGLIFILLSVGANLYNVIDNYRNKRFDQDRANEASHRQVLQEKNQELERRAIESETKLNLSLQKEQDLAIESARLKQLIEARGGNLKDIERRLKEEDERYKKSLQDNGFDSLNTCDRWKHNCETAKRLGVLPKSKECQCATVDR